MCLSTVSLPVVAVRTTTSHGGESAALADRGFAAAGYARHTALPTDDGGTAERGATGPEPVRRFAPTVPPDMAVLSQQIVSSTRPLRTHRVWVGFDT